MFDQFLSATARTQNIIGREQELAKIQHAIFRSDRRTQIVLISGNGGMGKSRLVEEVIERCKKSPIEQISIAQPSQQSQSTWHSLGSVIYSDLIDLNDARLFARTRFMLAIRNSLSGIERVDFTEYDRQFERYQRGLHSGAPYSRLKEIAAETEQAFLSDLRIGANSQRVVIVLDTAERLAIPMSQWLLDRGLLRQNELIDSTQHWLINNISNGNLENVTLLIAGREKEGKSFFNALRNVTDSVDLFCDFIDISVAPFDRENTQEYFKALAQDWAQQADQKSASDLIGETSKTFQRIAENREKTDILWLYTDGQPVRLALYAALIIESRSIPEPLDESLDEALNRLKISSLAEIEQAIGLDEARSFIENEFIELLLSSLGERAAIFLALLRAPRGLNAKQLHYVINAPSDDTFETWHKKLDNRKIADIQEQLNSMRRLAIIKERRDLFFDTDEDGNISQETYTERFGLQDEIYSIFAKYRSLPESIHDERAARKLLYLQLSEWARESIKPVLEQRQKFQEMDEQGLQIVSPASALTTLLPEIDEEERLDRIRIENQILAWRLERMYYDMLLDPERNINGVYLDLAEESWISNNIEADLIIQATLWEIIHNEYALQFVEFQPREPMQQRGEDNVVVLRRVAQQDDATRWIKRFVLRQEYDRAVKLCVEIDNQVEKLQNANERNSWNHTFARNERHCWRDYAKLLMSRELATVLASLRKIAAELEKLAQSTQSTVVNIGHGKQPELGFKDHPAEGRIKRVISVVYNFVGYGNTQLGNTRTAVEAYGLATKFIRETEFVSQRAVILNNLSRALSDMGHSASPRRICLDALALRRRLGSDIPIAYSWNTLALIDNDIGHPELAWREAATAAAYFRRANDPRGLGLALLQLGEALRRFVQLPYHLSLLSGSPNPNSPARIYDEAERALKEALDIFQEKDGKSSREPLRLIEVQIELGCLLRDRIREEVRKNQTNKRYYNDALDYLIKASRRAKELDLVRLELDAKINIAWTHYAMKDFDLAETELADIRPRSGESWEIKEGGAPPEFLRDSAYDYAQLSKIHGLKARIAMDKFRACANKLEDNNPDRDHRHQVVHKDQIAQSHLRTAAEAYVIGLAYSQLFSVRSNALSLLYDSLYDYLKNFNQTELQDFANYTMMARRRYNTDRVQSENLGNVERFLMQSFGISPDKEVL